MTQIRIQQYMEKHKITPLFEELMNKVLHDQPDDPLVYLIRNLYKKAGLTVPKDLKPGTLRRSSPERLPRRSKSPDKTTAQPWAIGSSPDLVDRSYDKPWLKSSKKVKPHKPDETEAKPRPGRKQKQGWNADTKTGGTTFDDLFEEEEKQEQKVKQQREEVVSKSRTAWASIGMEDADLQFRSSGYTGPRCNRNDDDPLAGEIMLSSGGDEQQQRETTTKSSSSHIRGPKLEAERHRQELEKLLHDSDKASVDSGYTGELGLVDDDVQDDAIELLEDPEDLRREGVTKIPKGGYKISKWMRQRQEEPQVKLNINLYAGKLPEGSEAGSGYEDEENYDSDLDRPITGMLNQPSDYSPGLSDDEFESVSQVVGPRQPVWTVPDSDGETYAPRPSESLPEPSPSSRKDKMSATAPVRFDDTPYSARSTPSDNSFLQGGKSWSAGAQRANKGETRESVQSSRSRDGGWVLPDDTEVSVTTQWTEGHTTGRTSTREPKAY